MRTQKNGHMIEIIWRAVPKGKRGTSPSYLSTLVADFIIVQDTKS